MKAFFTLTVLSSLVLGCVGHNEDVLIHPDNPSISYSGRFDFTDPQKPVFMYSGCGIRTGFTGTSAELILKDDSLRNLFTVIIDDSLFVLTANKSDSTYLLAQNLEDKNHTLEIYRRTEWHGGNTTFLGMKFDPAAKVYSLPQNERKIEFIGNSYTCGYGNEGLSQTEDFKYETENNYLTFGAITARALNSDYLAVCRSGIGMVQGYGGNKGFIMPRYYDEVTSDSTISWDYSRFQPHIVVIDLIGNDLSAKLDSAGFIQAYLRFLQRIRGNYPDARIICIAGPSSPGKEWNTIKSYIHTIVNEFSKADNFVSYFEFSPFEPHGSDWHPNVEEHKRMAEELIPFVRKTMNWN